ncbi:hypothetical protein ACVV2G_27155 [Streptomyces ziwulingensis]
MPAIHDMAHEGSGGNSRLNTAAMQDPAESTSRNHAQRTRDESSVGLDYSDVYEERAQRKESEASSLRFHKGREKAEQDRSDPIRKAVSAYESRIHMPPAFYDETDPRWISREDWEADRAQCEELRDSYEAKLVGKELAEKIARRRFIF